MNNTRNKISDFNFRNLEINLSFFLFLLSLLVNIGCQNNTNLKQEVNSGLKKKAVVKEKWHWGNPEKQSESAGYAQVVKVGNTIYISGVPTNDLSPDGITKLYKTLEQCLNSFGATLKDVVKETLYTTDIEEMKKHNNVRKKFYQGDYPAASWVQVSRLYQPNAKLEVDLIAEIIAPNQ